MSRKRWERQKGYDASNHRSGGRLEVPRTPVERITLRAKLMRLKREFMARQR